MPPAQSDPSKRSRRHQVPELVGVRLASIFKNREIGSCKCLNCGAPGTTRTYDPRLRKPMLYPSELRARNSSGLQIRGAGV